MWRISGREERAFGLLLYSKALLRQLLWYGIDEEASGDFLVRHNSLSGKLTNQLFQRKIRISGKLPLSYL